MYILRSSGTPFDLEDTHASLYHLIHKMNSFQIFRRHDVFIVHLQFNITLFILHIVCTATYLHTSPPVSRSIHLMQTEITLARHCHTECPVAEHLNTDQFSIRTFNLFLLDSIINHPHLLQIQFTCQYHYIGKASIKFQRSGITDI